MVQEDLVIDLEQIKREELIEQTDKWCDRMFKTIPILLLLLAIGVLIFFIIFGHRRKN